MNNAKLRRRYENLSLKTGKGIYMAAPMSWDKDERDFFLA